MIWKKCIIAIPQNDIKKGEAIQASPNQVPHLEDVFLRRAVPDVLPG
jgi:hypothetical protein